jgi:putative DNA base modification enzyme with NMAD domain
MMTAGRLTGANLCHYDPMFENGRCALGQYGSAQSHLHNNGVSVGDVFLFFGLFSNVDKRDQHHRIFGYLRVEERYLLGSVPRREQQPNGFTHRHPHTSGEWPTKNCLYVGPARTATYADERLRLSTPGEQITQWRVPRWLRSAGLTYHPRADCWRGDASLRVVGRGQEFISDISGNSEAAEWLESIIVIVDAQAPTKATAR